jgi:anti-sigma factor RsiW
MNCTDAATLIAAYVDGETSRTQTRTIGKHLLACRECAAKHDALMSLRAQLRAEVPRYAAPAALRARVLATLEGARSQPPARKRTLFDRWRRLGSGALAGAGRGSSSIVDRGRWLTGGALAGCAATVLAWFVGTTVIDWRANEDIAAEAVTSHVRATLGHQLIQVASSNQHTVKPWLSARLDYSPPVPDLQREGFDLVGGRVDYVDRHPVATLVYRIRDHNIDVFVRPESARAPPSALRTIRGFNVAHATGSGMDWLAVSDVSADVLAAFVQRLAREDATPKP